MVEAAGELPAKTGAPPKFKVKQLELDGMHSTDTFTFGFVGFFFFIPFAILYYYISVLFYFSFLLAHLMSFHLKWFVQSLERIWGEIAAVMLKKLGGFIL